MNRTYVPLGRVGVETLAGSVAAGDQRAAVELVGRFAPLIGACAAAERLGPWLREDLEQEGRVALIEAARTFDQGRGVPFAGWAAANVRQRVVDAAAALRTSGGVPMRVPRQTWRQLAALRAAIAEGISADRLACTIGVSEHRLRALQQLAVQQNGGEDAAATVAAPVANDPAVRALHAYERRRIMQLIAALPREDHAAASWEILDLGARAPTAADRRRALRRLAAQMRRPDTA